MLRTARRATTSTLATVLVAILVAMVAAQCVAALRWIVDWPGNSDRWWSAVVVAGVVVSIVIVHRARTNGETTAGFVHALEDPPGQLGPAPARAAATAAGVGLGVPLGFDGPALYLGGALAARAARLVHRSERAWTIAGGVAALSMAIDAPLAAALFAMELGRRRVPRSRDVMPLACGAFAAWLVRRLSGDPGGVLATAPDLPLQSVALSTIAIGIVAGVAGGWIRPVFARARTLRWRLRRRLAVGGVSLALAVPIGWAATDRGIFLGSGARMIGWARSSTALPLLVALVVLVVVLLALVAADVVGGLLLPLFTVGSLVGLLLSRTWLPGTPAVFALVAGGCAFVAAAHAAPATAIALGFSALGWSAASWAVAAAVGLAMMASDRRR